MIQRWPVVIFDFGNVVAHFDYRKACEHFGRPLGLTGTQFLERAHAVGFSGLVREYEAGRMSAEDFSRGVCERVGLDLEHHEFAQAWADIFWANEPIGDLISFLRSRGYTLVLGSNTNDLHAAQFRSQFASTLAHFDALVLSYEVGHIKPSSEFYLECARSVGANPADCVFIDDLPENIAGARAAGLQGIVYRDMDSLRAELTSLGVEVPSVSPSS